MFNDYDNGAPSSPPDSDLVYRNYIETCRRCGVKPLSRDHARDLMGEWFEALGRAMNTPKSMTH